MEIAVTQAVADDPEMNALVSAKSDVLRREIGRVEKAAAATWDVKVDAGGRKKLLLRLTDPWGCYEQEFAPGELQNGHKLELRLFDMAGELVKAGVKGRLEEWRVDLQRLYADLRAWSQHMELPPAIKEERIKRNEEMSGEYEVTELIFSHMGRHMKARPVARWVLGASGRVDIMGTEGPFILLNLKDAGGWHWLEDRPAGKLRPLTREVFLQLAEACLR